MSFLSPSFVSIFLIFFGCCLNVITLELLCLHVQHVGSLLTLAQFLFIILINIDTLFCSRVIPFLDYLLLSFLFYASSLLNNLSLSFSISLPVHTVFRSSSLVATLVLGFLFFNKRYSVIQCVSSLIVSAGILTVSIADALQQQQLNAMKEENTMRSNADHHNETSIHNITTAASPLLSSDCCSSVSLFHSFSFSSLLSCLNSFSLESIPLASQWTVGIIMLCLGMFLGCCMGHLQERCFLRYGRSTWKELMFYSHLLSLPGFLLNSQQIQRKFIQLVYETPNIHMKFNFISFISSLIPESMLSPDTLPSFLFSQYSFDLPLPLLLLLNLILQAVCIRGVYRLTSCTDILTSTLVITGRKCLSLLLSVYLFNNLFSVAHSIGTGAVFIGCFLYSAEGTIKEKFFKTKQKIQ